MTIENIKRVMDAFYRAKRIVGMLPPLPEGISPMYIRYLDVICRIEKDKGAVKVSDIGSALGVQRPGVTRTVGEMENEGLLLKRQSKEDGRVTFVEITPSGRELSKKYNEEVFLSIADALEPVSDEDVESLIETTGKFYAAISSMRREK